MTCEALERIMAPEIEAGKQKARSEGLAEGRILAYADMGLSVEEIADKVSLSMEEVERVIAGN